MKIALVDTTLEGHNFNYLNAILDAIKNNGDNIKVVLFYLIYTKINQMEKIFSSNIMQKNIINFYNNFYCFKNDRIQMSFFAIINGSK